MGDCAHLHRKRDRETQPAGWPGHLVKGKRLRILLGKHAPGWRGGTVAAQQVTGTQPEHLPRLPMHCLHLPLPLTTSHPCHFAAEKLCKR